jgi:hypothetical protein
MLFFKKNNFAPLLFVILTALLCFSYSDEKNQSKNLLEKVSSIFGPNKSDTPDPKRKKRSVTIVNKTGCDVKYFSVSVAGGALIFDEDNHPLNKENGSVSRDIQPAYRDKPELDVRLVDKYDRIYEKTFTVPATGNTETPVTNTDRKSEGFVTDKKKDLNAFMNGGC